MKVYDVLDVSSRSPKPTHAVWSPNIIGPYIGTKVPFQWGGQVIKYQHPLETALPLDTLSEECALIDYLEEKSFGPARYGWCYYKTVISDHLGDGARWADPCGAYGYVMADANMVRPGEYTVERLKATDMVQASQGAWSDAAKEHNIVNGYLVDTRRSWWDRLRYCGPFDVTSRPRYTEERAALVSDLHKDGSFPFREREQPYQEYFLDGMWHAAEREIHKRAVTLGMLIKPGDTVLDLGACLGGFTTWAHLHGASRCVGLDAQSEFVLLARRLARANGHNIGYFQFDLTCIDHDSMTQIAHHVAWLKALFPHGIDHLVCLSMGKHLSEKVMWWWVDTLQAKHTYLETNALKADTLPEEFPYRASVEERGGRLVNFTHDRNTRAAYRITR